MPMSVSFDISESYPSDADTIYRAWLDSEAHTAMTGGGATASSDIGGTFTAWDGYISGSNLELQPASRIVQTWRTTEFDESAPDSRLEILLEPDGDATRVTLRHSNLPANGMKYKQGWIDHYLDPMKAYFL
jgi:activator of HSP90 ATPase